MESCFLILNGVLRAGQEDPRKLWGPAFSQRESGSPSPTSSLALCHGDLLISCLAEVSDRWPRTKSASGVEKSVHDEADFLVSQLRQTIFQKMEVALRHQNQT